ncbi:hypothetical protein F5051DRAFT_403204 [Lentinula edodes]|nr:hypothetical protein F5051DRAFT_403204 [Lentinula edodes]
MLRTFALYLPAFFQSMPASHYLWAYIGQPLLPAIFVCHCAIPSAHRTLAPLAVGAVGCLCFHILSIFFPSSVNNFSLDFYEF